MVIDETLMTGKYVFQHYASTPFPDKYLYSSEKVVFKMKTAILDKC